MKKDAEIIAIGNEILEGMTVNTNASYISTSLGMIGIQVVRHTVIPDELGIIQSSFQEALERSKIIICTGGLGPTCDDITRNAAADLFHSPLQFNQELAHELKKRYGEISTLQDQATVPIKAKIIPNFLGTAYGFIFEKEDSLLILLPGVPQEMKAMISESVIPFLQSRNGKEEKKFTNTFLFGLIYEAEIDPMLRQLKTKYPEIDFGIYPSLGNVTVRMTIQAEKGEEAKLKLKPAVEMLLKKFSRHFIAENTLSLEEVVFDYMKSKRLTLSIAESCTGGQIAARLTKVPGCSEYFVGSVVAYSNNLKIELLGVKQETLNLYGAVSEQVVREMVEGVKSRSKTDLAIAVTGIAGPGGGSSQKPIGTVWAAILSTNSSPYIWKMQLRGNRQTIIERSVNEILSHLILEFLKGKI